MKVSVRMLEPENKKEAMMPRITGPGSAVSYDSWFGATRRIRWVSRRTDESGLAAVIRDPSESTSRFSAADGFTAAGKRYGSTAELLEWFDPESGRGKDIYGRRVLYVSERFPCFDAYDTMYETRRFRWFFIRRDGSLTRVFQSDGSEYVYVTEDVADIETGCCARLEEMGLFSKYDNDF